MEAQAKKKQKLRDKQANRRQPPKSQLQSQGINQLIQAQIKSQIAKSDGIQYRNTYDEDEEVFNPREDFGLTEL